MKRSLLTIAVLTVAFALVLAPCLFSQAKKDAKTGQDRFDGTIVSMNKDTSTITLRQTGQSATWQILCTKDTVFTYRNEPSTIEEVKDGRRAIILGSFPTGSTKMTATRVDIRDK